MAIKKVKNKQVVVTSDFDFGGNRITSLAEPIDNSDAVTLGYLTGNTISTFLGLTDTPSSYSGFTGELLAVNDAGDSIEFVSRIWREENNEVTLVDEDFNVLFYDYIELESDSGLATFVDKSITSSSAVDTEQGYTLNLDSNPLLKMYGLSDGTGGLQSDKGVSVLDNYFYIGDPSSNPSSNNCWRIYMDNDGDLLVEKRETNGDWSFSGKFN
jgi:hypothetical protein